MYVIGETTGDMQFTFVDNRTGEKPIDLQLSAMFGEAPRTVMTDHTVIDTYEAPAYDAEKSAITLPTCSSSKGWPARTGSPIR